MRPRATGAVVPCPPVAVHVRVRDARVRPGLTGAPERDNIELIFVCECWVMLLLNICVDT